MGKGRSVDVLVVGAGILGLSCAYAAARAGRSVCVLEREAPGAGASGGLVGALSPHLPSGWNHKKQLQFEALAGAEGFWREVADIGGQDPGYARVGRYLPVLTEAERARMRAQAESARENWGDGLGWEILAPRDLPPWLDRSVCPHGAVRESLSARLHPRRAIEALAAAVAALGGEVRFPVAVWAVEPGAVTWAEGRIAAEAIVLAAGEGGAALAPGTMGRGVKGQAALLAPVAGAPDAMVYGDGLYIVPHGDGTVAIGSTSEQDFADPRATDARLDDLIARAGRLCPGLVGAPVVERWAGVRPRGPRPDPIAGPLPGRPGIFVANGGFKTGFGFAPAIGEAVARMISGRPHGLPAQFLPK